MSKKWEETLNLNEDDLITIFNMTNKGHNYWDIIKEVGIKPQHRGAISSIIAGDAYGEITRRLGLKLTCKPKLSPNNQKYSLVNKQFKNSKNRDIS